MRSTAIVFFAALLLVSCTQPQPDMAGLKKAVDDYNAASIEGMTGGNVEKALAYYADDAVEMPPNEPAVMGRENIKAWQDKMAKAGVKITAAKFNTTSLQTDGNVGYEVGTYDMTMEIPQMGEVKDQGKYIATWMKHQGGSWKVHAEIWNSDNPVPSMNMSMDKKSSKKK